MSTARRLDAVASQLTVFERALLILRADLAGEERLPPDAIRILKPEDPDVKRIADAVFDANDAFYQGGSYISEWLYQEEIQLGWLRCLDAMLERDATLQAALAASGWSIREGAGARVERKARTVTLRALPEPGHGLERSLPLFWGRRAYPDEEDPEPGDLVSLRDHLAFEARRSLELRWRDLLAVRAVFAELEDHFAESMVHHSLAEMLDQLEAKVLELYEALCRRGERFPLPERDDERIAAYREWVRWTELESGGTGDAARGAAKWVTPYMTQRLEEMEARFAAELHAGATGVDFLRRAE